MILRLLIAVLALMPSLKAAVFVPMVRADQMPVNVKATPYYAYGDGVHDDTAAISNALVAATGNALYFPAGIYKYTNSLYVGTNTTLFGDGVLQQGVTNISIHLTNNCKMEGLTVDGGYSAYGVSPWPYGEITVYPRGTNITIQRVTVKNSQGSCIASDTAQGIKVLDSSMFNWRDHAIYFSTDSSNIVASGNYLYCTTSDANFEAIKTRKIRGGVTVTRNFGRVNTFFMNEDDTNGYPSYGFLIANNNIETKYHAILFSRHYSTNYAHDVNIVGNYFHNWNVPDSYTPFSLVWNESPGVWGAQVSDNLFSDYKDWGNLYYANGLSNALENVSIKNNTYMIGPKVNQTGSQLWLSYATNIAFEGNTIIDDGTNALSYPVLFGGPVRDIRIKGNTIRRSNAIRLGYFVAFATNNHTITAEIEDNTFDIRYRLALVTSTNQPGSGSLIKFRNNKWTSDYGAVMPYDNSIATVPSRWDIDPSMTFIDGSYTFNVSTNPGVPGSYTAVMTLDTNKLTTLKGNLLMGAASGTAYPQITLNSGDSGSGISWIDMGTPNRQYRITVGASPYNWNLSYIGNAAQAVTNGSAIPTTNIIKSDITGQLQVATNLTAVQGRITATNFTVGTTNTFPSITAGSGVPSAAEVNGSMYLKTDGTIYVRTNSAWQAIAGSSGTIFTTGTGVTNVASVLSWNSDPGTGITYSTGTYGKVTVAADMTTIRGEVHKLKKIVKGVEANPTYTVPDSENGYTYFLYGGMSGDPGYMILPNPTTHLGYWYAFKIMATGGGVGYAGDIWSTPDQSSGDTGDLNALYGLRSNDNNIFNSYDKKHYGNTGNELPMGLSFSLFPAYTELQSDGTNWISTTSFK